MPVTALHDEPDLLLRLKNGDERAFGFFYRRYSGPIYGNILKMVRIPEIAEELLQDVFQKIWNNRNTIDTVTSFKSYLFTISRNLVYDFFHKETRRREIYDELVHYTTEIYTHIEEGILGKETDLILNKAISLLPPQRKLVFTLCKMEGNTYEEVSRKLGISKSAINDHIVKATKFIKGYYADQQFAGLLIALTLIELFH